MRLPASTYRIQVRPSFDLDEVAGIADYLAELGADWVYLSPLLVAEPGSDHGYDVIDHRAVDPARGGAEGLERASRAAREAGLGVLVDIVPNHVGVATPALNPWWWDLLARGRASRYAEAFDVDWDAGDGRLRLPVLGSDADLSALELVVADGGDAEAEPGGSGFELRYYEHRFPVAAGTASAGDDPVAVHGRQHYELVDWRRADHELNYRRFFAVNTLAAVRVEEPWVFDESHAEILRWIREGLADGLRVDHPDGLFHPGAYLDRLAEATGGAYVLVEKILEPREELPSRWATAGTTGYDALGEIERVLVDPAGERGLDEVDAALRGAPVPVWEDLVHERKRAVADGILNSEVRRLARALGDRIARDGLPGSAVAEAVAELLACFPVYRSYLPGGEEHLRHAVEEAIRRRPDLEAVIRDLHPVLADPSEPAAARFQQTSGMVMAKGVEDNAFYRYGRLTSLTEVGGDPSEFALDVEEFHERQAARLRDWPSSMTTLSTHDTKRGEDVRARLDVLAELPAEWGELVGALAEAVPLGDGAFTNLLAQAIVGAWPAERERLHAYAEKAAREAGDSTGWADPDETFEERMHAFVDAVLDDPALRGRVEAFVERIGDAGRSNGLAAKILQLTAPGVPDVYQGSELWERSLVDPDNRRSVDFGARRELLGRLDGGWLPALDESGAAKLLVTSRALRLRRDRPELFTDYRPVRAEGPAAAHLVGFDRGGAVTLATRLPVGLARRGGWAETTVSLPAPMRDALTGRELGPGDVRLSEVFDRYPVALLAGTEEGDR